MSRNTIAKQGWKAKNIMMKLRQIYWSWRIRQICLGKYIGKEIMFCMERLKNSEGFMQAGLTEMYDNIAVALT